MILCPPIIPVDFYLKFARIQERKKCINVLIICKLWCDQQFLHFIGIENALLGIDAQDLFVVLISIVGLNEGRAT